MDYRLLVEKKPSFRVENEHLARELEEFLQIDGLSGLRLIHIYDIFGLADERQTALVESVLIDFATEERVDQPELFEGSHLVWESIPGQFDRTADAAMATLSMAGGDEDTVITTGKLLLFPRELSAEEYEKVSKYLINPVENRQKDLSVLHHEESTEVEEVLTFMGFIELDEGGLAAFRLAEGLAMSQQDLAHVQAYYREEKRNPTQTEIKVLDTYWSDHCRHTTFETELTRIEIADGLLKENIDRAYREYLHLREMTGRMDRVQTLMDMATIVGRYFRQIGKLDDMEVSEEVNACSVEIEVEEDGEKSPWLLMFKNETHNHPTEIEPYGGAGTCIGGAIRDPLSGRSYVYQAMRITGAGDVTTPNDETLPGKLPQFYISKTAARGYSDYGNEIGIAQTFAKEIVDPGFVAKRMELGAVVAAAPKENVTRLEPKVGDQIILLGGDTGRDGIGGATGSSVEQTKDSAEKSSSEVQKGNPTVERKILRLFRDPRATKLIKKSNDFGAGGVCVAIGELADGLNIHLERVPVKYPGLNPTELTISESQERMAVVIAEKDLEEFCAICREAGLEPHLVAEVTDTNRLQIRYEDQLVVDLSRDFLNTNGVRASQAVRVETEPQAENPFADKGITLTKEHFLNNLATANTASQKGLVRMFDSSVGRSTALAPLGGKYQLTEAEASVQKLPTFGYTDDVSAMAYGYDQVLASYSPYLGAAYSVVDALAKLVASGVDYRGARLTNQEFFERMGVDEEKWGKPTQALLGLIQAQLAFETPAIGGKDSMSGTFHEIHVPPTLVTFAINKGDAKGLCSPELKQIGSYLYLVKHNPKDGYEPNYEELLKNFDQIREGIQKGLIRSAAVLKSGGIAELLAKMAFGNGIGMEIQTDEDIFGYLPGSLLIEAADEIDEENFLLLGRTIEGEHLLINDIEVSLKEALAAFTRRYEALYPTQRTSDPITLERKSYMEIRGKRTKGITASPQVFVPILPGMTSEYDTIKAFEAEGAIVEAILLNDRNKSTLQESIQTFAKAIEEANILALVNGYTLGDEPNGPAKYLIQLLQNPWIKEAVQKLLAKDGLILGIDDGFKALVATGLLPFGEYRDEISPIAFSKNDLQGHYAGHLRTVVISNRSPWTSSFLPGELHVVPVSTGTGKLVADPACLEKLLLSGQIPTQYANLNGQPTMESQYNPFGAAMAVESLSSPDGRILGKMSHVQRYENNLFQNIPGDKDFNIFKNGVEYFK